ncbi:hypothetical protein ANCCAN_00567 [Ancylostoma caninum]|uniref:Peptidase S1 domain-containing protein n=1 Tax=Ancylostoma caninum TaxID=29170 RepID=A0A368HA64_ANCCA|nr:hypothetical protein ANCCAN_00567 [Ancylostoma caninum]
MMKPESILVFFGINISEYSVGSISSILKTGLNVSKITVHNFDFCELENDLALIELSQSISEDRSTPICMPADDLQLHHVLYASGFGKDPAVPVTPDNPNRYRGQQVVAQRLYGEDETSHKIMTSTFAKGILFVRR